MSTAQEVIKKFMKSLDNTSLKSTAALDQAVRVCSSFSSMQDVIDNLIADCKASSSYISFLQEKCGIVLGNSDTGAITGSDAGTSTTKTAQSVVSESGGASYPSGTSFTIKGLTVNIPEKSTLTTDQQTVIQGLYSWWIEEALTLIEESYGLSFTETGTYVNEITLKFENNPSSNILAYVTSSYSGYSYSYMTANSLTLTINMGRFTDLSTTDVNGTGSNTALYLDRTLAHELTHAVMATTIANNYYLPTFVIEGLAELVHGIDDVRYSAIQYLVQNPDVLEEYLNLDENTTGDAYEYSAGYILFRYLAKQASNTYVSNPNDIENTSANIIVTGTSDADTINNSGYKATINAGAGNDSIINSASNVVINTGSGNDTINNSGSNIIYQYANGNGDDIIQGYISNDTIQITSGTIDKSLKSGNDVILNIGSGSITLKEALGKNINLINGSGSKITVQSVVSNSNNNTLISGTYENDSITNSGNYVTINGGLGDDTVEGGSYRLIQYASGDGNDIIYNYSANDTIQITSGNISDSLINGNDLIFNIDSGSFILKNAVDKRINLAKGNYMTIIGGTSADIIDSSNHNRLIIYNENSGNDIINNYSINDTLQITSGTYSTQISGDDIIITTGENYITLKGAANNSLNIEGTYAPIGILTVTNQDSVTIKADDDIAIVDASMRTKKTKLTGNDYNNTILGGSGKDSIYGNAGDDSIAGNQGNDTLTGGTGNDVFVYNKGDGNDVITDYTSDEDLIYIASGDITSVGNKNDNLILKIGSNKISIKGGTTEEIAVMNSDGEITYYGKTQTLTDSNKNIYKSASYNEKIDAGERTKTIRITGNTLDNTILGGSNKDTLKGNDGNDYLAGGKGNDKIYGEADDDTLIGSSGADTLNGGDGADVFVYSNGDGDDVIADFTEYEDVIKIDSGYISSSSIKGSNVILNIADSSITIKKGKKQTITIIDSEGNETTRIYNNDIFLRDEDNSKFKATSKIITIDASKRTIAADLTGNSKANSIFGGSADDTLTGGKGKDTLTGGDGADVFVYAKGDGKDVITDYTSGEDYIKIVSGSISKASIKGSDVILKIGSNSHTITIKDGVNKELTIIDSDNKTSTLVYSINDIEDTWFTEDDNFNDSEINSILENNSEIVSTEYQNQIIPSSTDIDNNNLSATNIIIKNTKKK